MKTVFFIRHAKSSWTSGASRDIDRPLNARGRRDAPFMANFLLEQNIKVDGLLKSPAQRITETVAPFIDVFDLSKNQIITEKSIYEGSLYDILDSVETVPDEWECIFVFGHNPAMSYIAEHFGGSEIGNVPTCGILKVESSASKWVDFNASNSKISAFYYPKQFFSE